VKSLRVTRPIEPKVHITACDAIRTDYNKRSEDAYEALRQNRIDEKTYDKLGNLRQQGEVAFKRCFTERAPKQSAFGEAFNYPQFRLRQWLPARCRSGAIVRAT
jgi:hypothetical protein